jgi:hypothetical protein
MNNAVEQQATQEENDQAEQPQVQTPKDIAVVIRPLLKRVICDGDACRAAVFNQILYCIAWKREQGKDFWYGSYEEIYQTLLDASWGKSKVIKELNILVKQGYLEQRRNPVKGWDQTRQYLFGKEQAKKLRETCEKEGICAHQIGFPASVVHLLKITNAFVKNNNCISCKQQMQVVKSTDASVKNNKAIPKTSSKTSTKTSPKNRMASIVPVVEDDSDPEEDINKKENEEESPEEPRQPQLGFVKMAMRATLEQCGQSIHDTSLLERIDSLYRASGLDKAPLRSIIDKITGDMKRNGCRDIEVFVHLLEKALEG